MKNWESLCGGKICSRNDSEAKRIFEQRSRDPDLLLWGENDLGYSENVGYPMFMAS